MSVPNTPRIVQNRACLFNFKMYVFRINEKNREVLGAVGMLKEILKENHLTTVLLNPSLVVNDECKIAIMCFNKCDYRKIECLKT